ncbi:MAG: hypothetical protein RLZZ200_645 [Pseudomonadota bacterium]|jgi:hypothetical protein
MLTRRSMLVLGGALGAGWAILPAEAAPAAGGATRTLLSPDEPAARAIAYVELAAKVDPKAFPNWRRGQSCTTCELVEFGTGRARGCRILPGRLVLAAGWCKAWKLRGG